jgi:hypothetical protein
MVNNYDITEILKKSAERLAPEFRQYEFSFFERAGVLSKAEKYYAKYNNTDNNNSCMPAFDDMTYMIDNGNYSELIVSFWENPDCVLNYTSEQDDIVKILTKLQTGDDYDVCLQIYRIGTLICMIFKLSVLFYEYNTYKTDRSGAESINLFEKLLKNGIILVCVKVLEGIKSWIYPETGALRDNKGDTDSNIKSIFLNMKIIYTAVVAQIEGNATTNENENENENTEVINNLTELKKRFGVNFIKDVALDILLVGLFNEYETLMNFKINERLIFFSPSDRISMNSNADGSVEFGDGIKTDTTVDDFIEYDMLLDVEGTDMVIDLFKRTGDYYSVLTRNLNIMISSINDIEMTNSEYISGNINKYYTKLKTTSNIISEFIKYFNNSEITNINTLITSRRKNFLKVTDKLNRQYAINTGITGEKKESATGTFFTNLLNNANNYLIKSGESVNIYGDGNGNGNSNKLMIDDNGVITDDQNNVYTRDGDGNIRDSNDNIVDIYGNIVNKFNGFNEYFNNDDDNNDPGITTVEGKISYNTDGSTTMNKQLSRKMLEYDDINKLYKIKNMDNPTVNNPEPEPEPEIVLVPKTEIVSDPDPDPDPVPVPVPETETETKTVLDPFPETETETKTVLDPVPVTVPETETVLDPVPVTVPETVPETETIINLNPPTPGLPPDTNS